MTTKTPQTGHDAPVWARAEDFYDRWPVATSISRIIATAPAEWSTRIGLFGPWGDGKTSVLNFLEQQQLRDGNIVIRYAPWGASTPEEVWKDFGKALIEGLEKHGVSTAMWKRAKHWATSRKQRLTAGVKAAGTLAEASGHAPGASLGADFASTLISDKLSFTGKDIKNLTAQLGARRVVVFIDDLDRTDEAVVPKLLLVLRELLDFAQFAFVLAFDQRVVAAALKSANPAWSGSGASFLDKVIDFSVELPKPDIYQVKRLALRQFAQLCPFVPKEAVEKIAKLLPSNPRKLKLLARSIGSMEKEVARHESEELDWDVILLLGMVRAESEPFADRLLAVTIDRGEASDWEGYLSDDRDQTKRAEDELTALFDEFPELMTAKKTRIDLLVNAWRKAVPSRAGERLYYQAMFALAPHCITWGEFKQFFAEWRMRKDATAVSVFLERRTESSDERPERIVNEFSESIVNHYATILESALGVQAAAEHQALIAAGSDALDLLLQALTDNPRICALAPEILLVRWEKLLSIAARWRHFNSNPGESELRNKETTVLVKLGDAVNDPLVIYDKVRPSHANRTMFGAREAQLIGAMFCTLRAHFEPASMRAALSLLTQPGTMQRLLSNDEHPAGKFLLVSPRSPLFATEKPRLMAALESIRGAPRVVEDASDYLDLLLSALDHGDSRNSSADKRTAFIVEHIDLIALAWDLSVSEPSQFRVLRSLRERRRKLLELGAPISSVPSPSWLAAGLERLDIPN